MVLQTPSTSSREYVLNLPTQDGFFHSNGTISLS